MRKLTLILFLLYAFSAYAAERVYIFTDRNTYLSGDRVWCSLFCMDENGRFSGQSSVAYIELVGVDGSAAEAKIGLFAGRGSGEFVIPVSVPTGNYRLMAYTSLGREDSAMYGSRLISVYNTFSTARVSSGVIASAPPRRPILADEESDKVRLVVPGTVHQGSRFTLIIESEGADLAVSVSHQDDLVQLSPERIDTFMAGFPFKDIVTPGPLEYEGETVRAIATGAKEGSLAVLSSAGSPDDTYFASVNPDGSVEFRTGNIYGDREMVCEVMEAGEDVRIGLVSPFRHPEPGVIPPLYLHKDQFTDLVRRKEARSVQVKADTLVQFLQRRKDRMLSGVTWEQCHLDDYVRFNTVREVIVEVLPSVRIRNASKAPYLEISISDGMDTHRTFKGPVLTMMDGVVVSDLNLVLGFDALLLDDVYVCREPVVSGNTLFNGIVNFVTKNNYVTALHFPPQVCVEDFKGVRYPVAYTGEAPSQGRDSREVLYWHPALEVKGQQRISLTAPAYSGVFQVTIEGFDRDGNPVHAQSVINVK